MSMAFPETAPARLGADGLIAVDFGCPGCGYNLRAQRLGGSCPECGRTIDAQRSDNTLAHCEAGYLRKIQRGAALLAVGVLLAWPLGYPGLVVATLGIWQLTTPEPGRRERRSERMARNLARWFTAVGTPASLAAMGLTLWNLKQNRGFAGNWTLIDALLVGTHVTTLVGIMFAWRHLYDLAARADAPDAAVTLRRLWRRYFHALLFVGLVALAVNGYEATHLRRYIPSEAWLGPAVALGVAAVFTGLWFITAQTTRRLARILGAVGG